MPYPTGAVLSDSLRLRLRESLPLRAVSSSSPTLRFGELDSTAEIVCPDSSGALLRYRKG